jgi:hypothetical protein
MPDLEEQLRRYSNALMNLTPEVTATEARTTPNRAVRRRWPAATITIAACVAVAILGVAVVRHSDGSRGARVATSTDSPTTQTPQTTVTTPITPATTAIASPAGLDLHVGSEASAMSCRQATQTSDLSALITAFRAARLRGSGAEACMTQTALSSYCGPSACTDLDFQASPGPICLYRCRGLVVTDVKADAYKAPDGSTQVYLTITYRNPVTGHIEDAPGAGNENLTIGSGRPAGSPTGTHRSQLIVDATSSL